MNDQPLNRGFSWLIPGILFVGGHVSPSDLASVNIVCVSLCVCMFRYIHLCVSCINLCNCKIIWFLEVLSDYLGSICPCCVRVLLTNWEEVVGPSPPPCYFTLLGGRVLTCILLFTTHQDPHSPQLWFLYISMFSVVSWCCTSNHEDLELLATLESEHVAFVFLGLAYFSQYNLF